MDDELWSIEDVAELLGRSVNSVRKKRVLGIVPPATTSIGGRLYWRKSTLIEWMKEPPPEDD